MHQAGCNRKKVLRQKQNRLCIGLESASPLALGALLLWWDGAGGTTI